MPHTAKVTPAWRSRADGEFGNEQPEPFAPQGEDAERIMEIMLVSSRICKANLNDTLRITFRRGNPKTARDLGTWVAITHLKISADRVAAFFGYASADTAVLVHSRMQQALLKDEDLMAMADALQEGIAKLEK